MNILRDQFIQFLTATAIGIIGIIATLVIGIMGLPKRSKQPKTPNTGKLRIPRTRTARGCLRSLVTIIATFIGILYAAIQILSATQTNPLLNPWLALPLYISLALICIIIMLFALVRLIQGEETPLMPMQEQNDTLVQEREEET